MKVTARFVIILVLSAWLCAACQPGAAPSPAESNSTTEPTSAPRGDPDVEEYAVYAAFLDINFTSENIEQVLIVDQTRVNNTELLEMDLAAFQESVPLPPELVKSFKERNLQPYTLEPRLDINMDYQLLSQEEIDEMQPQDEASGWKLFDEKYPKAAGFIYLSRAGYNADLSQALVYYSIFRYEQPIVGGYYLMSRQNGRWVVEQSYGWNT